MFDPLSLGLQKEERCQRCMEATIGWPDMLVGIWGGAVTVAALCCQLGSPAEGIIAALEIPCQTIRSEVISEACLTMQADINDGNDDATLMPLHYLLSGGHLSLC